MENPDKSSDGADARSGLQLVLVTLLGVVVLNAAVLGLDTIFPGHLKGVAPWVFVEISIIVVAGGFAADLQTEKCGRRSRWRHALIYPLVWGTIGFAAYLFHRAFIA